MWHLVAREEGQAEYLVLGQAKEMRSEIKNRADYSTH